MISDLHKESPGAAPNVGERDRRQAVSSEAASLMVQGHTTDEWVPWALEHCSCVFICYLGLNSLVSHPLEPPLDGMQWIPGKAAVDPLRGPVV